MKDLFQIQIDFQATKNCADSLDAYADVLKNTKSSLTDTQHSLYVSWTGENSNAFRTKQTQHIDNVGTIEEQVRKIATTLRTMAKTMYDAEMQAYQLAATRK